jgi:hypothetical protein
MPAVGRSAPAAARAALLLLCLLALRGDACPERLAVTVTAYASGTVTASGRRPQPGMLALSRDVERALGVRFGDQVQLLPMTNDELRIVKGRKIRSPLRNSQFAIRTSYRFEDRMPRRWTRRVDRYLSTRHAARQFGIQRAWVARAAPPTTAAATPQGKGPCNHTPPSRTVLYTRSQAP